MLYQPIQSQFWWSDFKVYSPTWERFGTAPQTSEALADAKPAMRPGILPFAVLKIIINDTKSVNAFKEYWTYSWINFASKIYSTCLFKELVPREKAASRSFKSRPIFAERFLNAPISLFLFLWNSCLSSACLLNSPQWNTDLHFAMRQVRTVSFLSWQLLQHWPVFPSAEVALLSSSCFSFSELFTWAE